MANNDDKVNALPTLEDFTESSLLDSIQNTDDDDQNTNTDDDDAAAQAEAEEEARLKEEEAATAEQERLDAEAQEAEAEKQRLADEEADKDLSDEEKAEKDKLAAEKADEGDGNFWTDVENITGVEVEVDYGDTDPETPEGAAIREQALVKKVEAGIWEYMQKTHPKVYKALELEAAGGSITDIITPDYVDYSKIVLDPENETQLKKQLTDYYIEVKKLSPARAQRMVEADEDSEEENGLFKAAEEALKERQENQKSHEDKILEDQQAEAKAKEKQDTQMVQFVKTATSSGKVGNFNLPAGEQDKFFDYFIKTVQRNPAGGYMFAVPLANENFDQMMEQAYFSFKGGKLDQLVKRRATTESTRRLKKNLKTKDTRKSTASSSSSEQDKKRAQGAKLPTMDNFYADK
jgi:hypothetical protein